MARIAGVVVPDLPHLSPSAVIGASRCFSRPTTTASIGNWSPRRYSILGLLPDAQSRPPDRALADADGLRATFAEAHRRYTGVINARF
jgi:hypothetical protein